MPVPTTGTFLINCEGVKYGCFGIRYAASSQWWQRESRIGSAEQGIATLTEEIAAVEINIKNLDKAATEVINQRKGEHKEFWNKWHHTLLPRSICKEIRREHTIRSSVLPWEAYRAHPPPSYWSRRCIPYQLWRCQVCFLWKLEVISKTAFSILAANHCEGLKGRNRSWQVRPYGRRPVWKNVHEEEWNPLALRYLTS